MTRFSLTWRGLSLLVIGAALAIGASRLSAQGRAGQPPPPPPTPRAAAPIDLTGNWVSVVSEDWRFRMVTPPKGDYQGVPLTVEARKVAEAWDPARDEAAGEQCRSYGAPAIMRVPGRLRISWLDDNTLRVESDAGMQTRVFHFGSWTPPSGPPTWQGNSVAQWEVLPRPAAQGRPGEGPQPEIQARQAFGALRAVTTRMRPGYLRKNGIPYSAEAVLTEYWDLHRRPNGDQWIVITTLVHDPTYLQRDWVTSLNFKKEPDGSKWDPTPCSATW